MIPGDLDWPEMPELAGMRLTAAMLNDAGWLPPVLDGDPVKQEHLDFLKRRYDEGWRPAAGTDRPDVKHWTGCTYPA